MIEQKVTLAQLKLLAAEIADEIKNGGVIFLQGDLGAGKTAFTKLLAGYFKIPESEVKSPTFAYIKKHTTNNEIFFYHIDLYRAEQNDDLLAQEINELVNHSQNIIVIEWPEKIKGLNFEPKFQINFQHATLEERIITIRKNY